MNLYGTFPKRLNPNPDTSLPPRLIVGGGGGGVTAGSLEPLTYTRPFVLSFATLNETKIPKSLPIQESSFFRRLYEIRLDGSINRLVFYEV